MRFSFRPLTSTGIAPTLVILLCCLFATSALQAQRQLGSKPMSNGQPGIAGKSFDHIEGTYVVVNGINMYYEQYGEGEPILLIHGNGGSTASFDGQIAFLSRKFKVIVADSRGQGRSTNNADSLTYELMAEDYYLFLEQLDLDSVNILGWSDGGIIGLIMARDYPEKVKKLIAVGANLRADTTAVRPELLDWTRMMMIQAADSVAAGKKSFATQEMLMRLMLYHPDIDVEDLATIKAPVMIVAGDQDLIKVSHSVEIYQHIPHAQLSIYPNATHNLINEVPQLFNNSVLRFFMRPYVARDPMSAVLQQSDNASEEE